MWGTGLEARFHLWLALLRLCLPRLFARTRMDALSTPVAAAKIYASDATWTGVFRCVVEARRGVRGSFPERMVEGRGGIEPLCRLCWAPRERKSISLWHKAFRFHAQMRFRLVFAGSARLKRRLIFRQNAPAPPVPVRLDFP